MSNPAKPHLLALAEQWRDEFGKVMDMMADVRCVLEVSPEPPEASDMLWWKQPFDVAPGAALWIGAVEGTWTALGQLILAAAGVESGSPQELKNTYLEVLRQSLGAFATIIGATVGRETLCTEGAEEPPGANRAPGSRISISVKEQTLADLALYASRELLEAFHQPASAQPAPVEPAAENPDIGQDPEKGANAPHLTPRAYGTLNVLMDVEMPVSVSFGRTQVRVRDVLKLITGSVIELDRSISEPVEVIVNNCVIARGEVVVVEGNYGVRINEVMSRRERLQQSRKYLLPVNSHNH
jgi:flagellar motor switch protein FliN